MSPEATVRVIAAVLLALVLAALVLRRIGRKKKPEDKEEEF